MNIIITEISKYLLMLLIVCYTFTCFSALTKRDDREAKSLYNRQLFYIFFILLDVCAVALSNKEDMKYLGYFFIEVVIIFFIQLIYRAFYPKSSRLITNNLCMLLSIGFIVLTRLNESKAVKQMMFAAAGTVLTIFIPVFVRKIKFLYKLPYVYAIVGLVLLAIVSIGGKTDYGARLSFSFGGVSLQPSEFIKIVFVFFVAAMYFKSTEFKQVVITTVLAAAHVLILVASKDLGSASIYFVTYLLMLYVATKKPLYALLGVGFSAGAFAVAYKLFDHVRIRVVAFTDPLGTIDNEGYQVSQSLFAIGTGGWFGSGLFAGEPLRIPVVDEDFVFSAISEEMGGIFAICLILICASTYVMFLNISMKIKNSFYKLIALGLGTVYAFQIFLNIGGVIKMIPSTGVTLPLISYGGSSLISTFIIFAVIQGLYILRKDEIREEAMIRAEEASYEDEEEYDEESYEEAEESYIDEYEFYDDDKED